MAAEEILRRQVADRAGAPLPSSSAESFGAGAAQAAGQLAQQVHVASIQDYQAKRRLRTNADATIFQTSFASAREDLASLAREGRKSDQPGHAERLAGEVAKRREELLQGLADDDLRQRASASFDDWATRFRDGEADWEDVRQGELTVTRVQESLEASGNRVRRLEKSEDYAAELKVQMDGIGMLDVSDEVKGKLSREAEQTLGVSFLRGMTDRDPVAAKALLDSGAFDDVLTPDQVDALRNGSEVEIRTLQRAAEREAEERAKKLNEAVATLEGYDRDGIERPDSEYDAAIAIAAAQGDTSRAEHIATLKANKAFTREWGPENANALQRQRRLSELAGMKDRSDNQDRELKFLRDHAPAWAEQENRDAVGQAKLRGGVGTPPEIDLVTGQNWNPRATWAASRGHDVFDEVEVRALQEDMDRPGGEARTLAKLDQIADPMAKARAARQLAPTDEAFPIIAMVKPQVRSSMLNGRQAMKDNASFFAPKDEAAKKNIAAADASLHRMFRGFRQREIDDFKQAWRYYAAGTITRAGAGDAERLGTPWGERAIETALTVAMGGEYRNGVRYGGPAIWNGDAFPLPETQTLRDFRDRVYADLKRHTVDPPVNPDKSPLATFNPPPRVMDAKGVYHWESAGGQVLRTKSGKIFHSRVLR